MAKIDFKIMNSRVTFKNVPLHKLANFSFQDINAAYNSFKKIPGVSECVILQTASRVEVFTVGNIKKGDIPDARRPEGKNLDVNKILKSWTVLSEMDQWDIDHWDQTLEMYTNADVYEHLLRLAVGLDSVVVGKEEILDEIKKAVITANENGASGEILNKLFGHVVRIATSIRDATGITKSARSIGDVGVHLAEEKVGLDKKKILLAGTGETAAMVAKSLNKTGLKFDVVSMTIERATGFSKILGGTPVEFEAVLSGFDKYDVVFVGTTADYFLLTYERIRRVMLKKTSGVMILDLSDPRAVEESVTMIPGLKLVFRDQIAEIDEEKQARRTTVSAAEKIISDEAPILEANMKGLEKKKPLAKSK